MVQLSLYQFLHGYSTGVVPKSFNSFREYAFAMYQVCRVILMVFSAMPDNVPGFREWNSTIDSS